jgi:hypothetical protein
MTLGQMHSIQPEGLTRRIVDASAVIAIALQENLAWVGLGITQY